MEGSYESLLEDTSNTHIHKPTRTRRVSQRGGEKGELATYWPQKTITDMRYEHETKRDRNRGAQTGKQKHLLYSFYFCVLCKEKGNCQYDNMSYYFNKLYNITVTDLLQVRHSHAIQKRKKTKLLSTVSMVGQNRVTSIAHPPTEDHP